MVTYASHGGQTAVDHVDVMGFVRSDVVRVTLVLRDGLERNIPLNPWRGFGFTEREAAPLVTAIRAYGADGEVLDDASLHIGPLCGGEAGPCSGERQWGQTPPQHCDETRAELCWREGSPASERRSPSRLLTVS